MHQTIPLHERLSACADKLAENYSKDAAAEAVILLRKAARYIDLEADNVAGLRGDRQRMWHALSVAEALWHTLRRIEALQTSDHEDTDDGALVGYSTQVRELARRRLQLIADLPTEGRSSGDWLGLEGEPEGFVSPKALWRLTVRTTATIDVSSMVEPAVAAFGDLLFNLVRAVAPLGCTVSLVRRGIEVYAMHEPSPELVTRLEQFVAAYRLAVTPVPTSVGGSVTVERLKDEVPANNLTVLRGERPTANIVTAHEEALAAAGMLDRMLQEEGVSQEMREVGASNANIVDTAARVLRQAAVALEQPTACVRPLPPDLVTRAAAVATALDDNYAENTMAGDGTGPTISDTAVTVLREIIAAVEASSDSTLETRFVGVHSAVDGAGGPRTMFRFQGLPDVSVPDADADKLVARHIGQSGLKDKVAAAICNNSNFPEPARVHVLGRDLSRLIDAVLGALGAAPVEVGVDLGRGDETVVTIVDVETGERREMWRAGDRCTINGEGSTVFTLRELRADVAMPVDPSGQPNGWKSYEQMHKVTAETLAERAQAAAAALRKLGLGEPASSVVTGAADVLSEAGEALRGPEATSSDPDLAERTSVMSTNLMTVLERWADAVEPVRSAIVTAAALFSEVAERLKVGQQRYWLVDEYNDTEGETFGIAVRASREVDRALLNWATSYEAMLAAEHGMTPNPVVIGRKLTNGGDALTFLKGLTSADLEAIENGSDNDYGARVRILSAEGTRVLLDAINDTPPGGSLSLYKGTLSTCKPELEDAEQPVPEPTDLADLWAYEEKGAWEETDEPPQLGEHDADLAATAVPDQPGTLEAVYHQQGWSLVAAPDGRATHLFRRDGEVGVMFVGPTACGIDVAGEVVKPLSERFDYPPHPELCGRCCAGANDQR